MSSWSSQPTCNAFACSAELAPAEIAYTKVAEGTITAEAHTSEAGEALLARLEAEGRVQFGVDVTLRDEAGQQVATLTVAWHVSRPR